MNCSSYTLCQSDPPVQPAQPDPQLVRRLFTLYAGPDSAMTAACQYFYDSLLTGLSPSDGLSELFACLSRTKTRQLAILGRLILAYGGDPGLLSYRSGRRLWWSGEWVQHSKQPAQMLSGALAAERAAIRDCRALIHAMPEDGNRAVLERLLADDAHHIQLLETRLAQIPAPAHETRARTK